MENVPSEGGALLVEPLGGVAAGRADDHAGDPPRAPGAPPAVHARRALVQGYPGVGMLTNKLGLVAAHAANAQRLLGDEGRLRDRLPRGQKGSRKLYWQRYRLRRFGRGGFVRTATCRWCPSRWWAPKACRSSPRPPVAAAHRPDLLPGQPRLPALRAGRGTHVPARQVQDPLPRSGRSLRLRTRRRGRPGARPVDRRGRPRAHPVGAGSAPIHVRPSGSARVRARGMWATGKTRWSGAIAFLAAGTLGMMASGCGGEDFEQSRARQCLSS